MKQCDFKDSYRSSSRKISSCWWNLLRWFHRKLYYNSLRRSQEMLQNTYKDYSKSSIKNSSRHLSMNSIRDFSLSSFRNSSGNSSNTLLTSYSYSISKQFSSYSQVNLYGFFKFSFMVSHSQALPQLFRSLLHRFLQVFRSMFF